MFSSLFALVVAIWFDGVSFSRNILKDVLSRKMFIHVNYMWFSGFLLLMIFVTTTLIKPSIKTFADFLHNVLSINYLDFQGKIFWNISFFGLKVAEDYQNMSICNIIKSIRPLPKINARSVLIDIFASGCHFHLFPHFRSRCSVVLWQIELHLFISPKMQSKPTKIKTLTANEAISCIPNVICITSSDR